MLRSLLGVVCIVLVLLAATMSVAHAHADGAIHADCGFCTAAHTSIPVGAQPVQVPFALVGVPVTASLPPARSRAPASFALFTRPPPSDADLS